MPNALTITLGGVDITTKVEMSSVSMQLAGSQEIGICEFDVVDEGLTVVATAESTLSVTEVSSATVLFGGFTRSPRVVLTAVGRLIHIKAADYNSLLDRSIVVSDSRTAGESDHARLVYLMTTYGTQFSSDYTQIATLKASMVAQKFIAITLRQAIERVLGQASTKSSYMVDATGRLVTYDRSVPVAAPFNIRVGTPGGGEISPDDFTHDRDTDNLANAIYIVGATAAGSGWFTDTTSISTYGRRERFFNAPDSDTHAKAMQVGLAVLEDQKDPIPRVTFTTQTPNDGWRIGQTTTVNSTQDNLVNVPLRVAKVTTRYLNGLGSREYSIELGAPQRTLSALLASAHGGGGGFPWHSPGGAGWAGLGGFVGSGTTGGTVSGGGSCACNTPYGGFITFDDFNTRTTTSDDWGDTSSGLGVWLPVVSGAGDSGVSGGFGVLHATTVQPLVSVSVVPTTTSLERSGGGLDIQITFKVDGIGTPGTTDELDISAWGGTVHCGVEVGLATGDGVVWLSGSVYAQADFTDWSAGVLYNLRWQQQHQTGTARAKVWRQANAEPDWMVSRSSSGDSAGTNDGFELQLTRNSNLTSLHLSVDEIDIVAPANSGQPYPWTDLGAGNSSQTAFTFPVPYRTGSLEVRVDTTPITPSAQTPTTGVFTLPFPPSSVEHIWARAVTA